jgi:hypothetical protein
LCRKILGKDVEYWAEAIEKEEAKVEAEADQAEAGTKIAKIFVNTMIRDTEVILEIIVKDKMKWKMRGNQQQSYQM